MVKDRAQDEDPLAVRVRDVVQMVQELKRENAALRVEVDRTRDRLAQVEEDRGTVRHRIQRMLDMITG